MKKILFLVTQSEMGGAQRYLFEVARLLDKERFEVIVGAGQGDGELFKKLQSINTRTVQLKQLKRTPRPWQIFLTIKEIYSLLKQEKPAVLFLCSTTAGILGSITSVFYNVKVVYRIGGWAFRDPRVFWKNWLILLAEKLTSPLKDVIIVNSEIDKKLAIKHKITNQGKLVKIYNGLDADSLKFFSREEARQKLSINNMPTIGTVANFYKTKGLKYLIEAMPSLNCKLVIIGEGKERSKLEALITRRNLKDKVYLVGRLPNAYQYLKAFDIFVLPSLKEGFPWIILEAIAAQIPIIATKVGALPEILDEEFLVKAGNFQELAKKISRMLEYPAEPRVKQEFTFQKMMKETVEVLSKL